MNSVHYYIMQEGRWIRTIGERKSTEKRRYPTINMPQECGLTPGDIVKIVPTVHEGKLSYIITPVEECTLCTPCTLSHRKNNSSQNNTKNDTKIFSQNNGNYKNANNKACTARKTELTVENKEDRSGGPAEIRTQDPRRVKAMS